MDDKGQQQLKIRIESANFLAAISFQNRCFLRSFEFLWQKKNNRINRIVD